MRAMIVDERDNVAVMVEDVKKGGTAQTGYEPITANEDIRSGHKIARKDIRNGEMVMKFNTAIGRASAEIKKGDWVHTHNVEDITEQLSEEYCRQYRAKGGKK